MSLPDTDLSDWLAIAALVVSTVTLLATYHIAVRQGAFRKERLTVGFVTSEGLGRSLLIFNIGRGQPHRVLVPVTLILQNGGDRPILSLALQVTVRPPTNLQAVEDSFGPLFQDKIFPENRFEARVAGDAEILEWTFQRINPGQTFVLPIPYWADVDRGAPGSVQVHVSHDGPNHVTKSVKVVTSSIDDIDAAWLGGMTTSRQSLRPSLNQ